MSDLFKPHYEAAFRVYQINSGDKIKLEAYFSKASAREEFVSRLDSSNTPFYTREDRVNVEFPWTYTLDSVVDGLLSQYPRLQVKKNQSKTWLQRDRFEVDVLHVA